jgi:hypothetical protein
MTATSSLASLGEESERTPSRNALVILLDAMASPVAPVATLFGSTGGVSASGRPATKTAGQRRNVVDDDDAAVRLVSRRSNPTRHISPPPTFDLFETNTGALARHDARTDEPNEPSAGFSTESLLRGCVRRYPDGRLTASTDRVPLFRRAHEQAYQVADETVESEEKRRETETEARRDALVALRRLVKEVDADAWKYSKPRHAMR